MFRCLQLQVQSEAGCCRTNETRVSESVAGIDVANVGPSASMQVVGNAVGNRNRKGDSKVLGLCSELRPALGSPCSQSRVSDGQSILDLFLILCLVTPRAGTELGQLLRSTNQIRERTVDQRRLVWFSIAPSIARAAE